MARSASGSVEGDVALVTGAGRGLGLAITNSLRDAGRTVYGTYRTEPLEHEHQVLCDIRDPAQVDAAFDEVEAKAGPITTVVANAGIGHTGLLLGMSDEEVRAVVDTNLLGSTWVARRAIKSMAKARRGRLVFLSSVTAHFGFPGVSVYGATKSATVGLARSLAREVGPRGVTVNVVAPGMIQTEMLDATSDRMRSANIERTPLGRVGTPEEIAATVRFLCSDEASFITGAVLSVDGGLSMGD